MDAYPGTPQWLRSKLENSSDHYCIPVADDIWALPDFDVETMQLKDEPIQVHYQPGCRPRCSCYIFNLHSISNPAVQRCMHSIYMEQQQTALHAQMREQPPSYGDVVPIGSKCLLQFPGGAAKAPYFYYGGCGFIKQTPDRGLNCGHGHIPGEECDAIRAIRAAYGADFEYDGPVRERVYDCADYWDEDDDEEEELPDCSEAEDDANEVSDAALVASHHAVYSYPCPPLVAKILHEQLTAGPPDGCMRPQLPDGTCDCGCAYSAEGYEEISPACIVYCPPPHYAVQRPLQVLQCPNRSPGCLISYSGLMDGLLVATKDVAISLELLYQCLDGFVNRGQNNEDFVSSIQDRYARARPEPAQFMSTTLFRQSYDHFRRRLLVCWEVWNERKRATRASTDRLRRMFLMPTV